MNVLKPIIQQDYNMLVKMLKETDAWVVSENVELFWYNGMWVVETSAAVICETRSLIEAVAAFWAELE